MSEFDPPVAAAEGRNQRLYRARLVDDADRVARMARLIREARDLAATSHLDDLSPDQLADFLATYLRNRAQSTQDIEDLTDDASDSVQAFLLGDSRRVVTIESPNVADGIPFDPEANPADPS